MQFTCSLILFIFSSSLFKIDVIHAFGHKINGNFCITRNTYVCWLIIFEVLVVCRPVRRVRHSVQVNHVFFFFLFFFFCSQMAFITGIPVSTVVEYFEKHLSNLVRGFDRPHTDLRHFNFEASECDAEGTTKARVTAFVSPSYKVAADEGFGEDCTTTKGQKPQPYKVEVEH